MSKYQLAELEEIFLTFCLQILGSVAASENTEDPGIKKGTQHMLFALATNVAIDWGFVIAAFVPLVMIWIFGLDHLRAVWRISLGGLTLGA